MSLCGNGLHDTSLPDSRNPNGACKECRKIRRRQYRSEKRYSGPGTGICPQGHTVTKRVSGRCHICYREATTRMARAARLETIQAYGGVCVCCGEDHAPYLQLDHVGGGGNAHRRVVGNGAMWRWAKRHGYPDLLQLLCANCNTAKARGDACSPGHDTKVRDSGSRA